MSWLSDFKGVGKINVHKDNTDVSCIRVDDGIRE